jgi:hypothetical protein
VRWKSAVVSLFPADFLLGLFFEPKDGGHVPPKRHLTFNGLHGVISQMIEHFITTAVYDVGGTMLPRNLGNHLPQGVTLHKNLVLWCTGVFKAWSQGTRYNINIHNHPTISHTSPSVRRVRQKLMS